MHYVPEEVELQTEEVVECYHQSDLLCCCFWAHLTLSAETFYEELIT